VRIWGYVWHGWNVEVLGRRPQVLCSGNYYRLSVYIRRWTFYLFLENEVIGGCIDILIVAVQDYLEDGKVKTLVACPSRTSLMRRRLPTPLFPAFFRLVRTPPEI